MTTLLDIWAIKWGVSIEALNDLKASIGIINNHPVRTDKIGQVSEAGAQQAIRFGAPGRGVMLWRNNNGVAFRKDGVPIRFGLGNDSESVNKVMKSGDLIGVTSKIITPADIGHTLGIFTSYEVKRPGWKFAGTAREISQQNWNLFVVKHGGIAKFTTGPGDIWPST